MLDTITFRADDDVRRALAELTADGTSVSVAVVNRADRGTPSWCSPSCWRCPPCSLRPPRPRPARATFRPEVGIAGRATRVLAEQTAAVDPGRLGEPAGYLSRREMQQVDAAPRLVLGP